MLAKVGILVLFLVCMNSALLVFTVRSNQSAAGAKAASLSTCRTVEKGRVDVNQNRILNMQGWTVALNARLANAATADGRERSADLAAARVYRHIVTAYSFLPRPSCTTIFHTGIVWERPPAKPTLPTVPTR